MRYFIQKKELGSSFRTIVKDEHQHACFLLIGTWGANAQMVSVYSMDGKQLAFVKKRPYAFGTRYDFYEDFQKVGSMRSRFPLHIDFYYLSSLNWYILGHVLQHEYNVYSLSQHIMKLSTTTFPHASLEEAYRLDVSNPLYAPLSLCIASVLDYWLYTNDKQKAKKKGFFFAPNYSLCSFF